MSGRRLSMALLVAVSGWLVSCCPARPPAQAAQAVVDLTLLYTSDEHGWMEPSSAAAPARGGLMQLLDQLVHVEGHCAGAWPEQVKPDCSGSQTLLLSGGDNYTGPALSSYFRGSTMADAMRRLGYVASAFGNHELDFGPQQFFANRERADVKYLAANLSGEQPHTASFAQPYLIVERAGVRIGVIGLATPETPRTAAPHRFKGLTFEDIEKTLDRVVPQVWQEGVDAAVVLAHECPEKLEGAVARHPEWRLSFVGAGHCHVVSDKVVGEVPLIAPDWRARRYARIKLRIDKRQPLKRRATVVSHALVEVVRRARAAEVDKPFARRLKTWRKELEGTLGQEIGYSQTGMSRSSTMLSQWILRAWRDATGADVALTTRGAIRQELKPGPITHESVLSVLPFDNELLTCEVPGSALAALLERSEVRLFGVARSANGQLQMHDGSPLDLTRRYRLATTDFLYAGGDGMSIAQYDAAPKPAFKSWRDPVISWTAQQQSSAARPLETLLTD